MCQKYWRNVFCWYWKKYWITEPKARDGKITIEDLQGGTFTITNGIYGSMLSTPILNPPQSAVLDVQYYRETYS